jgi:hypothetical protein
VNPDCFHLANRVFNNSTRTEIKNVEWIWMVDQCWIK